MVYYTRKNDPDKTYPYMLDGMTMYLASGDKGKAKAAKKSHDAAYLKYENTNQTRLPNWIQPQNSKSLHKNTQTDYVEDKYSNANATPVSPADDKTEFGKFINSVLYSGNQVEPQVVKYSYNKDMAEKYMGSGFNSVFENIESNNKMSTKFATGVNSAKRKSGYYTINGVYGWFDNPDEAEFGKDSNTYKTIHDAYMRCVNETDPDKIAKQKAIAENARELTRQGIEVVYLTEEDINSGVTTFTNVKEKRQYKDVTNAIDTALKKVLKEAQSNSFNIAWFYDKVNPGAEWDIKVDKS